MGLGQYRDYNGTNGTMAPGPDSEGALAPRPWPRLCSGLGPRLPLTPLPPRLLLSSCCILLSTLLLPCPPATPLCLLPPNCCSLLSALYPPTSPPAASLFLSALSSPYKRQAEPQGEEAKRGWGLRAECGGTEGGRASGWSRGTGPGPRIGSSGPGLGCLCHLGTFENVAPFMTECRE